MAKITHFGSKSYINREFEEHFNAIKDRSVTKIIEGLQEFDIKPKEITLSLINMINNDLKTSELILYFDVLNYYISFLYDDKKDFYINLLEEKLLNHLANMENVELKSVIYQFVIDYSPLYQLKLERFKSAFPIDKTMLLKRITELATTKKYLNFFLAYELLTFFTKEDINSLWDLIITLSEDEQIFVYKLFHLYLKNKKKIFSFISKLDKEKQLDFLPYLKNYYPENKLRFLNSLDISNNEWEEDLNGSWFHKGFFSKAQLFYFSETNSFIFITEFFDFARYNFILECDLGFNHLKSHLFKQPMEFNKDNYILNMKNRFTNSKSLTRTEATTIFKQIIHKITHKNFTPSILLLDYFIFRGGLEGDYIKIENEDLFWDEELFDEDFYFNLFNNEFESFINFKKLLTPPKNIDKLHFYLKSPSTIKIIDDHINKNFDQIKKRIKFLKEISYLLDEREVSSFFHILYLELDKINKGYILKIKILYDYTYFYLTFM